MKSIDIDIGGTFTDCYVQWDNANVIHKAPTTPYNLSVGLMNAIKGSAELLQVSVRELLNGADIFRYSTTIAMNRLIERKGPKLALITTEGHEDVLTVGKGSQWADGMTRQYRQNLGLVSKPEPLIERYMIAGVKERVDYRGRIVRPLNVDDARQKIQYLVDQGARGFVVSLLFSFMNSTHERQIKDILEEEYPDYLLGRLPIVLSSDVHPTRFEYSRTNVTTLNAYLHQAMADEIRGIRDEVRRYGYTGSLLMVHNTGGMAESFLTAAVNTYNGGPSAGLIGAEQAGSLYAHPFVIFTDMGGTSFDLGVLTDEASRQYLEHPVIDRWLVDLSMVETRSIGAGGGSIARLNPLLNNRLEVGPESAGSMPGPVSYNQGGTEPTVTDADVVLGYIDPDYFYGGKLRLNAERARHVIEAKIARPLGVSVEEAALLIRRVVDAQMGYEIFKSTVLKGHDPRKFYIVAAGGAAGLHCCDYAEYVGIKTILTFPFSPVFCAHSSAYADILHIYEQSRHIPLVAAGTGTWWDDPATFNEVVAQLKAKAMRDIANEGIALDDVVYSLDLDMKYGGQLNILRATSPCLEITEINDFRAVYKAFEKEYMERYSPMGVYFEGGVNIENFVLKARVPQRKLELSEQTLTDEDPKSAQRATKYLYWKNCDTPLQTHVYDRLALRPGNRVLGPAIVQDTTTTYAIPIHWSFYVDRYSNGICERIDA